MKKILLIHGWGYTTYYHLTNKSAWIKRAPFVNGLKKEYEITYFDLPGFGQNSPARGTAYNLDDYAKYVHTYIQRHKLNPDYILGYSFGAAVAIRHKKLFKGKEKLILISPAISRVEKYSKKFKKTPTILNPIRNKLRNFYVAYIKKIPEMAYGDKFLRNTYQNIVREDLTKELQTINPKDIKIIFGEKDKIIKTNQLEKKLPKEYQKQITYIKDGNHEIANSHTEELIEKIKKFTK